MVPAAWISFLCSLYVGTAAAAAAAAPGRDGWMGGISGMLVEWKQ